MPGIDGAAKAPMIASVANVPLSSSDSNQRSRMVRAGPVRTSIASLSSVPSLRNELPSCNIVHAPPMPGLMTLGGVMCSVGSTTEATRSSIFSYLG